MVNWFVYMIYQGTLLLQTLRDRKFKTLQKMKANFKIHPITEVTFNLIRR